MDIPELSLVVLIGPSGSGKSTFARRHFKPTEILTSDMCRALVADDENAQDATTAAFEVLHLIAAKRLEGGRLTVVDATNVQPESRKSLVEVARKYYALVVAIVFDLPERLMLERNKQRTDRNVRPDVIRRQKDQMKRSVRFLNREGFRYVYTLDSEEAVNAALVERRPLWVNRRSDHGPFDIIGDVHGCFDELKSLLESLGYSVSRDADGNDGAAAFKIVPPDGRKVVFLGDLVDRGPNVPDVLRLVMSMVTVGSALCVPGNHEQKLVRALQGRNVQVTHGLAESLGQIGEQPAAFKDEVVKFLDGLISHYVLDDGKLVVAHAGLRAEMQGRASAKVRDFAMYGETTGETDEFGLPVRYNWAAEYRGRATVVYGHTPVPEPAWLNGTINIDTGCVFGGKLTALRYPERELVSVPAARTYYEPAKPFLSTEGAPAAEPSQFEDMLEITDVFGKRIIETRLFRNVTVPEENAAAALELMSRFAVDPHWLIYLPPTMSPSETSTLPGLLEHPSEAFSYYRKNGIPSVVCEEKHMGSRAVAVVCRNEDAARKRFQVTGGLGAIYTRTGRPFFSDGATETELLARLQVAIGRAGWWDQFSTDWVCLDCEVMPWSAKALELLRHQYAAVGAAARTGLAASVAVLERALPTLPELGELLDRSHKRADAVGAYVDAYRRYCWPVTSIEDLRIAPFHLLATERTVHIDKDHSWHMETIGKLVSEDEPVIMATSSRRVDVTDPVSEAAGIAWWEELTGRGGEGIVVKPLPFVARSARGLVQPAVKCRGPEYLRIIYGPEYTLPENLERLRARGLGLKRSLALREFALGVEALERFARHEPLHRVHECVFAVLALESEPVDPRL